MGIWNMAILATKKPLSQSDKKKKKTQIQTDWVQLYKHPKEPEWQ